MSEEVVMVKVEPPDEFESNHDNSSVYQNGLTENVADESAESSNVDKRNFTCLLCDLVFENRDDLRRHLKVAHTAKHYFTMPNPSLQHHGKISESVLSGFSSYVNYRYTCTVCGAKFKAFRSYLTHSMSHRGTGSLRSQFDDVRMATILSSGKQYLQDYIDSEDGFPASFTCDECKTVFSQRDSYAMHMMMRAMNETCVGGVPEQHKLESPDPVESSSPDKMTEQSSSVSPRGGTAGHSDPQVSIKSLEDVTAKVDQDEYLKSVLDRVFVRENMKYDTARLNSMTKGGEEYKLCTFCGNSFEDQDSLAMHVMSDHAAQIIPNKRKSAQIHIPKPDIHWPPPPPPAAVLNSSLACKICAQTFVSRDSLAMHVLAHTQENSVNNNAVANQLKRLQSFEDYTHPNKIAKSVIDPIDMTTTPEPVIKLENGKVGDSDMYCNKCDIHFYAESEFTWHNSNKHSTGEDSTIVEPLCLAKSTIETKENNALPEETLKPNTRIRRNSFSFDENSRLRNPAPRRPLSAGNIASSENTRGDVIEEERATDLSQKSTRHVTPNLNALSSHEQRIIYSVFGKDLRVNNATEQQDKDLPDKVEEPKEAVTKPPKVEHRVRPNTTKSPLNLSYAHARPMTSPYSGYPNGEKDHRSVLASLPKDVAMCKYCDILFLNKAIYYLHMGLHNVNNPWQCNVCGKVCVDAVDFAAHVIHM